MKKRRERGKESLVLFVDPKKAVNLVPRDFLFFFFALAEYGVPPHLI